jgi:leucyl/phenylalanyl-tRNA--protein transferase
MFSLVELLKSQAAEFIDCQMQNPHLASLGCIEVSRDSFLTMLHKQSQQSFDKDVWQPQILNLTKWL